VVARNVVVLNEERVKVAHGDEISTDVGWSRGSGRNGACDKFDTYLLYGSFAGGQVGSFGFVNSKSGCDEDGRAREMR
jgi:hypothetical protein